MRIIAGIKRGKKLNTLAGERVRPTTDRVKESLFNILQFQLEGRVFLDLFAGSGQIGLEALSRGGTEAVFVESSPAVERVLRQNIKNLGFDSKSKVFLGDCLKFLKNTTQMFDIIYIDPPFGENLYESALQAAGNRVKASGLIICEHLSKELLPDQIDQLCQVLRRYRYGTVSLTVYQPIAADVAPE